MILVVSDLHLGKVPAGDERSLADLRSCIDFLKPEISQVVFLGDTFDAFIEYPGRLPRPVGLWTSWANELQQEGIEVAYFAGNHDRWHINHINKALDIPVERAPKQIHWQSNCVWMEHGDLVADHSPMVRFLRYVSDHKWAYLLYRTFLPFGMGHRLAAEVSRKLANFSPDPKTEKALKSRAEALLAGGAADVVIMGHCHSSLLKRYSGPETSVGGDETGSNRRKSGIYVNTGDWYEGRTFVTLSDRARLLRWTSNRAEIIGEEIFK